MVANDKQRHKADLASRKAPAFRESVDSNGVAAPPTASQQKECVQHLGIRLIGRYDCDKTSGIQLGWPGAGIVARIRGTGLRIKHSGSALQYTVIIDGTQTDDLKTSAGTHTYSLASGLSETEHVLELYRRGEGLFGPGSIEELLVDEGTLLPPVPASQRRIEIIGDSITCGYGNEGKSPECSFSADTENHYLSYGALLARSVRAELSTIAWSGKGVVVNYGGEKSPTLPDIYQRAIPDQPESLWDFSWQPHLVIINLGTNDYSTDNDPDEEDFISGYISFLTTIRTRYPASKILCTVGPLLTGTDLEQARQNIEEAVSVRITQGDENLSVFHLRPENPSPGCDYHPGLSTHEKMAKELRIAVEDTMGW